MARRADYSTGSRAGKPFSNTVRTARTVPMAPLTAERIFGKLGPKENTG